MKFKNHIAIVAIFLLAIISCKKETTESSNINSFIEYIASFPESRISATPNLQFYLKKPIDATNVSDDVISISPNVEGTVSYYDNIISFVPKEKLKYNQEYKITLHLSKLYNTIEKELEDFVVTSKTKELLFSVALEPLRVSSKGYTVEGTINSSDVFEAKELPSLISVKYKGADVPVTFDASEGLISRTGFKIEDVKRYNDDEALKIVWNGKPINSSSKGERELTIVGKNNFKVLDVSVQDGEEQEIKISFSDPILKKQDLDGLIQFQNTQKKRYTYKINSNVVTIYPASSFKKKVDVEIFKQIKSVKGISLSDDSFYTLYFDQPNPSVSFVNSGTILPNSANLKINFNAVNLRAVDVTVYKIYKNNVLQFLQRNNLNNKGDIRYVGRPEAIYTVDLSNQGLDLSKENAFAIDLADLIAVQEGALYRIELSFNKLYSNYTCSGEKSNNTITYGKKEINTDKFDTTDSRYSYHNDYRWRERNNPCHNTYYYDKGKISTNVLASNLGVIVKKGNNNSALVAVSDILTTQPISGANVTLFNLQKQEIASTATDKSGIATFKDVSNAYFAVVSQGKHTTYVKLNDGNSLSMSKFDVSGAKLQEGIQGYIYGERGVWRPGDRMYLTFVLNDNANPLPENHPITFELINPRGKMIDRKVLHKTTKNVYAYTPETEQDDVTGNYNLRVTVGKARFSKTLKVETIKPNRLKIKFNLGKELIKVKEQINANISVKWLHGAIARNLKYDIAAKFYPTETSFKGYHNYNFDDVTRKFGKEELTVSKGLLGEDGTTNFSIVPTFKNFAAGMLNASFITKVYENGGDFSTDVFSQKVSPYSSYVGLNPAEEKQSKNFLFTDEEYTFNVANLNEEGSPVFSNDVEVNVYKLEWRWWWRASSSGLSEYDGSRYKNPFSKQNVAISNGKGNFSLKIKKGDWGRFLVKVKDKRSGHVTSNIVYFDWPSWYGKKRGSQDKSNATMLVFSTDKAEYKVGEKATVQFPSSEGGRALITVENGTEVLDHFWVDTKDKLTSFEFPILSTYAPNAYVNISFLQKHSQTKNDLPIRMYGSAPISVYDPVTKLEPELEVADEINPESTITVSVEEKNNKPMTYTIAMVDDGLLDLTRFKTPNPWNSFYVRQSLGVKTWDVYDNIIGAYGGNINQILSIGGDQAKAASKNKRANRFKPMVIYLGPFQLDKGEKKNHKIKIPQYVGSVRTMVVASNVENNAYGNVEKTSFVRKPVMILASLPRKITPKEIVTLPVTVFAMKPTIKNVKVTLEPSPAYEIIGQKQQVVSFNEPDEKMTYFKLKVKDFKGIANIKIKAASGGEKATYEVEMDVLNPNPLTTETQELVLQSNERSKINFNTFGSKGTNITAVELSTIPPMNFTSRLDYLIQYPHGCVEQTTSSAFPQLYFNELFDLQKEKANTIERNVKATIQRLNDFQLSSGGLSYWIGGSRENDWGTCYAGHFMVEASKKGYVLPIGFLQKWKNYQKQVSKRWRVGKSYRNNAFTQAYRLYTLALANSPDLASMNRLRETKGLTNPTKLRLAGAYALVGKASVAKQILKTLSSNSSSNYSYNYGSETRNKAMELETYTVLKNEVRAIKLAKKIAEDLSSNKWMSTQTTAYSLIAISEFALQNGENTGIKASFDLNGVNQQVNTSKTFYTFDFNKLNSNNTFSIANKSKGVLYVQLFNKGILPVGQEKELKSNLDATIRYYNKKGIEIYPNQLTQGTNFMAVVKITNTSKDKVENVALTQYIPSGWEIINTRFTSYGSSAKSSGVDFTDIRDASISNYFTLNAEQSKVFRVLLNASYLGEYYLPGIQAEAMYNNDYLVRTKGQWVKVVK